MTTEETNLNELDLNQILYDVPQGVLDFIATDDELKIIEDIGNFIGINNLEDERMINVGNLVYEIIVFKKIDKDLNLVIKKYLNFLDEEKVISLENYIREKYKNFIEDLWQKAELEEKKRLEELAKEKKEEIIEELEGPEEKPEELTFEERERRYLELMKEIYGIEPKRIKKQEEKPKEPEEEKKVITITPSEEPIPLETKPKEPSKELIISWEKIEEKTEPELPEGTIIIKKKEESETEKKEDLLDLSSL